MQEGTKRSLPKTQIAIALAVLALAASSGVVSALGASSVPDAVAKDASCLAPEAALVADEGEMGPEPGVDALLKRLYALFVGMDGFIDVYYHPELEPAYRPLFVGSLPEAAAQRVAEVPLGFDVVAQAPMPAGPGTLPDVNDITCNMIRPGALINNICTTSFLFSDGTDLYISTAGHCIATNQPATVGKLGHIGNAVFSTGSGGVGNDFAIVKLLPSKHALATAEMCDWAGPTGTFGFTSSILGQETVQTGYGSVVGYPPIVLAPPRPKVGVGVSWGATSFTWVGSSIPGDSGSAIRLESGNALGTVTHISLAPPIINYGTRWDHGVALAAAAGYPGLVLQTVSYTHL
jgi:hypothetical protein